MMKLWSSLNSVKCQKKVLKMKMRYCLSKPSTTDFLLFFSLKSETLTYFRIRTTCVRNVVRIKWHHVCEETRTGIRIPQLSPIKLQVSLSRERSFNDVVRSLNQMVFESRIFQDIRDRGRVTKRIYGPSGGRSDIQMFFQPLLSFSQLFNDRIPMRVCFI